MSKRRKRRSSSSSSRGFSVKKKRSGFRTFVETVMGVSIGLLILVGAVWWFFLREVPETTTRDEITADAIKDNVVDSEAGYEQIRDEGSLDELFKLLSELSDWPRDAELPVRLSTLDKRLEIAQTILKREGLKEEQRVKAAKDAINAMGQIYGINHVEGLDEDGKVASKFLNIAGGFANDKNASVQKDARVARVKTIVFETTKPGWDGKMDSLWREFEPLVQSYPNDHVVMSTIGLLNNRVGEINPASGVELSRKIVNAYERQAPEEVAVRTELRRMKDQLLVRDVELDKLTNELVANRDIEAFMEVVGKLIDAPDTGVTFLNSILEVVGFLETKGEYEYVKLVLTRLQQSVANRTSPGAKVFAARIARFGLLRNKIVGTKIDFNDTDMSGNPVDIEKLTGRPSIIAYYSPNLPNAQQLINRLNQVYEILAPKGVQVVTVGFEKPRAGIAVTGLHPDWVNVSNGDLMKDDEISKIFMQLPVSQLPYYAIVTQDGIVDRINVPLSQLSTHVDNMLLQK